MNKFPGRIISLAGYPGSGKTTIADKLVDFGFMTASASEIIDQTTDQKLDNLSRDSRKKNWENQAQIDGRDWLAKIVIKMSQNVPVVFDGLRIFDDAKTLKGYGATILYIHSEPEEVLSRIRARQRPDDAGLNTVEDIIAQQTIEDDGEYFKLSLIRTMADRSVLPIINIDDLQLRNSHLDLVVRDILQI